MLWPDFVGPSYRLDSPNGAPDETINFYGEVVEKGPRAGQQRLRQIPGLRGFCVLPTVPVRALWAGGLRLFAIGGSQLYEIYQDGTVSPSLGNVGIDSLPAEISSNGFQFAIASAGVGYITGGPLVPIPGHPSDQGVIPILGTDGQPVLASSIVFLDQYFIASITNSKQIRISNLAPAGGIWDPGDAAIKEGYSDNIVRNWVDQPGGTILYVHGAETLEFWQDTAGLFPFGRIQGGLLPIGCDSAASMAGLNGMHFWLWRGTVYMAAGTAFPQRVSDYGVEQAIAGFPQQNIAGYSDYDQHNCEGSCYIKGGHTFYSLSFPEAGVTWVYDTATQSWHKRLYWKNNQWGRYRPRMFARQWSLDLCGDYQTGQIYVLDPNVYTDANGTPLRRDRIAPYITDQMKNLRMNRLTMDMDTGVGLNVAPNQLGYDPQIGMRYSTDRGKTWSNWRQQSLGKIGETNKRVFWTQMGNFRIGGAIQVSITDPVEASINGAYIDIGQGTMAGRP